MEAVVFEGDARLRIDRSQSVPVAARGEALIRVHCAGICGSDITHYLGKNPRAKLPVVPGHEIIGTVEGLGAEGRKPGRGLTVGSRVAVLPTKSCGECDLCAAGARHLCRHLRFIGVQENGGMAEYLSAPIANLYPVPDLLADATAALCEPLAVALHALKKARPEPREEVLVIGAGPIGLLVANLCRLSGSRRIVVSEIVHHRIEAATSMGFETIPADRAGAPEAWPEGEEPRVVFECTGHPSAAQSMVDLAAYGGRVIIVGAFKEPPPVDLFRFARKELEARGSFAYSAGDFAEALALLERERELFSPLVTHRLPLARAQQAIDLMREGRCVKVLLEPARGQQAGESTRGQSPDPPRRK